jgi:hypothetical protein
VVVAQPRASPSVQKVFVPCGQEIRQFRQQIRQLGQKAGAVSEFMVSDGPNSRTLETLTICRLHDSLNGMDAIALLLRLVAKDRTGHQRDKQIRIPNQFSLKAKQP